MNRSASASSNAPSVSTRTRKPVNYADLATGSGGIANSGSVSQPKPVDQTSPPIPHLDTNKFVSNTVKAPESPKPVTVQPVAVKSAPAPPPKRVSLPIPSLFHSQSQQKLQPQTQPISAPIPIPSSPIIQSKPVTATKEPPIPPTAVASSASDRMRPIGARKMSSDADLSWKELYEDLYEKSCTQEQDQTMKIQELKRTCADLEMKVLELQKELMELKRSNRNEAEKENQSGGDFSDVAGSGDGLSTCVLEVQELTQKIKKSLNIPQTAASNKAPAPLSGPPSPQKPDPSTKPSRALKSTSVPQPKHDQSLVIPIAAEKTVPGPSNQDVVAQPQTQPIQKPDPTILTEKSLKNENTTLVKPKTAIPAPIEAVIQLTTKKADINEPLIPNEVASFLSSNRTLFGDVSSSVEPATSPLFDSSNAKKEGSFESDMLNIMNSFGF